MSDIEYLLRKYNKQYVKGGYIPNKISKELKRENRQKEKIRIATMLCASLNAPNIITQEVIYCLNQVKHIKFFNRRWCLEKLISMMIICEYQLFYDDFDITSLYLWDYYDFDFISFEKAKTRYYKHIFKRKNRKEIEGDMKR